MHFRCFVSIILGVGCTSADILAGRPDPAPSGYEQWISPIVTPSPLVHGDGEWAKAVSQARAFVHDLTLEEKVNLTTGIGLLGPCLGNTGSIPRKNFQGFCLQDGPAGVRKASNNSVFPAAVNIAATWDRELMYKQGRAMGAEFRAKGVHVALAPGQNLHRAPAAGRNFEMPGADPYLAGATVKEQIRGIQSQGVVAVAKHLLGNEQEHARGGSLRQGYSTSIDDRTLHEVYLWPFAESINAGVASIMTSYNRLNQTFAAHNSFMLNGLVKGMLGFQGFIMSDWSSQTAGVDSALAGLDMSMPGYKANGHGDPSSPPDPDTGYPGEADPSKGRSGFWGANLVDAVRNGTLPEERLTDMAVRIMAAYFKLGQDENFPEVDVHRPVFAEYVDQPSDDAASHHAQLIREMGAASTVLLKNEKKALPLRPKEVGKLGIFGSDAGRNPDGPNACEDRACFIGTNAMGWGSGTADFPYLVDPYQAIEDFVKVRGHGRSTVESVLDDQDLEAAARLSSNMDVCLVFVGSDAGEACGSACPTARIFANTVIADLTVEGNEGDRNDLELWHGGAKLVQTVAERCNNTIVVIHSPGPVNIESFVDNDNVTAIVAAGQPGQESGNGLVDVLFGKVNPSGRLPYTWAKDRTDYPDDVHYFNTTGLTVSSPVETIPQLTYSEGLLVDYRWFEAKQIKPRYAFGYGLSYTTFYYDALKIHKLRRHDIQITGGEVVQHPLLVQHQSLDSINIVKEHTPSTDALFDDVVKVEFSIKNTGNVAGHEVSQLYLSFPEDAGEPMKVLRNFERTYLEAGKAATVTMALRLKDISIWDVPAQRYRIPRGTFKILVGSASDDIRLVGKFDV